MHKKISSKWKSIKQKKVNFKIIFTRLFYITEWDTVWKSLHTGDSLSMFFRYNWFSAVIDIQIFYLSLTSFSFKKKTFFKLNLEFSITYPCLKYPNIETSTCKAYQRRVDSSHLRLHSLAQIFALTSSIKRTK